MHSTSSESFIASPIRLLEGELIFITTQKEVKKYRQAVDVKARNQAETDTENNQQICFQRICGITVAILAYIRCQDMSSLLKNC